MSCLQLRPFEREHLPLAEPWSGDAATQRGLGGPGWPRLMPDRAGRRDVIGAIDIPAGSISYVVDPALRRRGRRAVLVRLSLIGCGGRQ